MNASASATGPLSLLQLVPLRNLAPGRGLDLLPVVESRSLALWSPEVQPPDHLEKETEYYVWMRQHPFSEYGNVNG